MDTRSARIGYGGPEDRPVVAPEPEPFAEAVKVATDVVGNIIAYESGELSKDEIIAFFQHLVDTGLVGHLQGHYGRTAQTLIAAGYVKAKA